MASDKRVFLWSPPRCVSTAFWKAMTNLEDCQAIFEPFHDASNLGEERMGWDHMRHSPIKDGCTYAEIKAKLENPKHGKRITFVKDLVVHILPREDYRASIPRGYIHTFLIRDPRKAIPSLYKTELDLSQTDTKIFECSFKELLELFIHVTQELGQRAILVDADDLVTHPESIMRQYCDAVGLHYVDNLVQWKGEIPGLEVVRSVHGAWVCAALDSSSFDPDAAKHVDKSTLDGLPADVRNAIDQAQPYYAQLRQFKLNP